jgi:hypothetical protein
MTGLPQITIFPWQKRNQTDSEEETPFSDQLPWQQELSPSTCPWVPAGGESGPAALVPSPCAHFINKGASSASWLHDMDTCPLSIGPGIWDFHKGQPTAGRQEPPGHCHPGLNWNMHSGDKGSVCNHSMPPSLGISFAAPGPLLWKGHVVEGAFPGLVFSFPPSSITLSCALQGRKAFPACV